MLVTFRCRTDVACAIAGISQRTFQGAVDAGAYPHAPQSATGGPRMFSQADVAALVVYAWMRQRGLGAKLAGRISELALDRIDHPAYARGGNTLGVVSIDLRGFPSLTPAGNPPAEPCRLIVDAAGALASAVAGARTVTDPVPKPTAAPVMKSPIEEHTTRPLLRAGAH